MRPRRRRRRARRRSACPVGRVLLIGGAAQATPPWPTSRRAVFGRPVLLAEPGEYVADGAARQAAQRTLAAR
ncbi:MAG: hypothetical protein V9F04_13940 [Dermatophilaceae bacterium]